MAKCEHRGFSFVLVKSTVCPTKNFVGSSQSAKCMPRVDTSPGLMFLVSPSNFKIKENRKEGRKRAGPGFVPG